jgi:hypothetical protein
MFQAIGGMNRVSGQVTGRLTAFKFMGSLHNLDHGWRQKQARVRRH